MKSKRGEIGETIAWIFAFIIIIFIIGLFLSTTGLLAASKSIPVLSWILGTGKNTINLEQSGYQAIYPEDSNLLLSIPIETEGENILLRDIVFRDIDANSIKNSVSSFLATNKISSECYGLVYESSNSNIILAGSLSKSFIEEKGYGVSGSKGRLYAYAGGCE